jgi:imidazolonepropionase-like amidohydrolase
MIRPALVLRPAAPSELIGENRPVRTLYRDAALADGRSSELQLGVSVLVEGGRIAWIRPVDGEEDAGDAEVVDAGGTTIVPGMVDCHSHLTLPGGSHWIDRGKDTPEQLLEHAEHNAKLQTQAGVRWARDVGAPIGVDPVDGRERALSLGARDRWRGHTHYPYVRAAGSWVTRAGTLPAGLTAEANDADELLQLALRQLDDGADLVKLYLDGPDPDTAPWTPDEVRRVVAAAHERGARVTAHAGRLSGTRVCAEAAVDCIEHGFEVDEDCARLMAVGGIALVSTLTVLKSWMTFGHTTTIERFASADGRRRIAERWEAARASIRAVHSAGVLLGGGTDFGGGSPRANQLAWEVEALTEAGLEPWEALAAVTWKAGEILGESDAGQIREGGPPDFFLVHGDPLSDPAALWRVWRVAWTDV